MMGKLLNKVWKSHTMQEPKGITITKYNMQESQKHNYQGEEVRHNKLFHLEKTQTPGKTTLLEIRLVAAFQRQGWTGLVQGTLGGMESFCFLILSLLCSVYHNSCT